jgi:hypothetical protein
MFNACDVRKRAKKALVKAIAEYRSAKKNHREVRAVAMEMNESSDEPIPDASDE